MLKKQKKLNKCDVRVSVFISHFFQQCNMAKFIILRGHPSIMSKFRGEGAQEIRTLVNKAKLIKFRKGGEGGGGSKSPKKFGHHYWISF